MTRDSSLPRASIALGVLLGACGSDRAEQPCGHARPIYRGQAEALHLSAIEQNAIVSVRFVDVGPPCSGVLIAPGLVLTAAHCAESPSARAPVVRIGPDEDAALATIDSVAFRSHGVLDAGLIELSRAVPSTLATPIQLSSVEPSRTVGARAEIAGYGTSHDGTFGERRFASELIAGFEAPYLLLAGMGKSGACGGDSGGPVLWWQGRRPVILGILKDGEVTCVGTDRYTSLIGLRDWLLADPAYERVDSSNACGALTEVGTCFSSRHIEQAVWCEGGERVGVECPRGERCSWVTPAGAFRCTGKVAPECATD